MNLRVSVFCFLLLFLLNQFSFSQGNPPPNLLDTSTWNLGNDPVVGFPHIGTVAENLIEVGLDNVGNQVKVWKVIPDSANDADGGWDTDLIPINFTNTYRFTVWVKKTNSDSGLTQFGLNSENIGVSQILNLDNSVNSDPFFWEGDLPILNRWYLLVGFVHKDTYNSTVSLGKIYDGVTGQPVIDIDDYKFSTSAIKMSHRTYLYYDTNTNDRQFFYDPTIYLVTGNEPSINELLNVNSSSSLRFAFDSAGNQKTREYCFMGNCGASRLTNPDVKELKTESSESVEGILAENNNDSEKLKIYPNPTKNMFHIDFISEKIEIRSIYIYTSTGVLIHDIPVSNELNTHKIDLSNNPSGFYFLHIHFSNDESISRKIIKS